MKLTDKQKNDVYILTSGHYLCETIPSDWEEMDGDVFYKLVCDHAWEPFEYWDGKELFECISSAADITIKFIENLESNE